MGVVILLQEKAHIELPASFDRKHFILMYAGFALICEIIFPQSFPNLPEGVAKAVSSAQAAITQLLESLKTGRVQTAVYALWVRVAENLSGVLLYALCHLISSLLG